MGIEDEAQEGPIGMNSLDFLMAQTFGAQGDQFPRSGVLDTEATLATGLTHLWTFQQRGGPPTLYGLTGRERDTTFGSEITASDWAPDRLGGWGLNFTRALDNSHVDIGEEIDGENITVAVWAEPTFAYTDSKFPGVFGNVDNGGSQGALLGFDSTSDKFRWACVRSGGAQLAESSVITSNAELGQGRANLFVGGSDAAGAFLDINGVERGTSSVTGTYVQASRNHWIGGDNGFNLTNGRWGGPISFFAIWNRKLEKSERVELFNGGWSDLIQESLGRNYFVPAVVARALPMPLASRRPEPNTLLRM